MKAHRTNLYTLAEPISAAHVSNQSSIAHLVNPFKGTERLGEIFGNEKEMDTTGKKVASGGVPGGSGDPDDFDNGKGGYPKGNPKQNPLPV